ncbi:MAG: hypothetical protein ACLP4V_13800 [Methylocella sp.]
MTETPPFGMLGVSPIDVLIFPFLRNLEAGLTPLASFLFRRLGFALKDARATPAENAKVTGHEQGFPLSVYAPMELPADALQELIEHIRYEGLQLDHLHV